MDKIRILPIHAALDLRFRENIPLDSPIDIFSFVKSIGISLKFKPLNKIDGYCENDNNKAIVISTLRPRRRQCFTCAHELGHLILHQKIEKEFSVENELEADVFAGTLLMTEPAIRKAFNDRGISLEYPDIISMQAVASWLGVSVIALHTQMSNTIRNYRYTKLQVCLLKKSNDSLSKIFGYEINREIIFIDRFWNNRDITVSEDTFIVVKDDQIKDIKNLKRVHSFNNYSILIILNKNVNTVIWSKGESTTINIRA